MKKKTIPLRSVSWFGRQDIYGFIYRSWTKNRGIPQDQFDGRPVIGICNTFSELTPCNSHFRTLAEQVKIGVYEAGGFPLEFPTFSTGEVLMRPTAILVNTDFRGKIVVLEWTNDGCPYVKKHYGSGNMQKLQQSATKAGHVWWSPGGRGIACSRHVRPSGAERNYARSQQAIRRGGT